MGINKSNNKVNGNFKRQSDEKSGIASQKVVSTTTGNKRQEIIAQLTGYRFKDTALIDQAFSHTSFVNEHQLHHNASYERLEFLGDAVLELTVSKYLYYNYVEWPEGKLTRLRAALVCEENLSRLALDCHFDQLMLLGRGEDASGGRKRPSLLCDVFEAVIGALYLEGGYEVSEDFIISQVTSKVDQVIEKITDYKTLLQEKLQMDGPVQISYDLIEEKGPAHQKSFLVAVSKNETQIGIGRGNSKKVAEQAAAQDALSKI